MIYRELAPLFHVLTPPDEYADEAASALALLRDAADGPLVTLLELGSGGGNLASHLRREVQLTLTDLSDEMLALSRTINPECEQIQGDMRTLRLNREDSANELEEIDEHEHRLGASCTTLIHRGKSQLRGER